MKEHKRKSFSKSQEKHKKVRLRRGFASCSNRLLAGASSILVSICIIASPVSAKFTDGFVKNVSKAEIRVMSVIENVHIFDRPPKINSMRVTKGSIKFWSPKLFPGMYLSVLWDAGTVEGIIKISCVGWHYFWSTCIGQDFNKNRITNIVGRGLSIISNGIGNFDSFSHNKIFGVSTYQFWLDDNKIGSAILFAMRTKNPEMSKGNYYQKYRSKSKNLVYIILSVFGILLLGGIGSHLFLNILNYTNDFDDLRLKIFHVCFKTLLMSLIMIAMVYLLVNMPETL